MNFLLFDKSDRLRSGWRVAIFLFGFIFVAILLGTAAKAVFTALQIDAPPKSSTFLVINAIVSLIPAILIGWLCGKLLENLPFRALGAAFTNGWWKNWILGNVFGALTLSAAVAIVYLFGGLRFVLNDAGTETVTRSLALSFFVFGVASAFEEALFRGYILQTFARSGLAWLAILLTSLLFGFVHLDNPDAGIFSTLNTILAGVWFSVAYLKTRNLWFVWGMHLMWNWMQGSFFGIEVSGLTGITTAPLLREIDHGPIWLTGEAYGIEGGIACTIALVISTIAIYFMPFLKSDETITTKTVPIA